MTPTGDNLIYASYNIVGIGVTDTLTKTEKKVFFQRDGKTLKDLEYVFGLGEKRISDYVPVAGMKDGVRKMGLANTDGKVVLPLQYDKVEAVTSFNATVATKNNRAYVLYPKEKNKEILLPESMSSMPKLVGKSMVEHDLYGDRVLSKIDETKFSGREDLIKYSDAFPDFYLGMSGYAGGGNYFSLYRGGGKLEISGFEKNISFSKDYIVVQDMVGESNTRLYDKNGKQITATQHTIYEFSPNGFIFKKNYKNGKVYGLLDPQFNVVVPPTYEWIQEDPQFGFLVVRNESFKKGIITWKGETILQTEFQNIRVMTPNDFIGQKGKKNQWLDGSGNVLLEFDHLGGDLGDFYLTLNTKVPDMAPSLAVLPVAKTAKEYQLYGRDGKLVTDYVYEELQALENGIYAFKIGGKYGLMDIKGKEILTNEYDRIYAVTGYKEGERSGGAGIFRLVKGNMSAICNRSGKILLPFDEAGYKAHLVSDKHVWVAHGKDWEVYELVAD